MAIFFGKESSTTTGNSDVYADAYDEAHRCLLEFVFSQFTRLQMASLMPFPFGCGWTTASNGIIQETIVRTSDPGKRFRKAVATLDEESRRIIKERKLDPNLKSGTDLLALFMNAHDENGVQLTDDRYITWLRDMVLSFVIAGRDTTACTLSWLFYELSQNPEVQEALYEELTAKLGKDLEPTYENMSVSNLPYLNGCIYECLRLHPPVPNDPKSAREADTLPGGVKVPAGTVVSYSPYIMGRCKDRYPDPLAFKPERWIPFTSPDLYEFPVRFRCGHGQGQEEGGGQEKHRAGFVCMRVCVFVAVVDMRRWRWCRLNSGLTVVIDSGVIAVCQSRAVGIIMNIEVVITSVSERVDFSS